MQDKYAKLQSQSLSHRSLYLDITEVVKALNGESSRLDASWYAPILMRKAINSANEFGDTHAAQVLAQAGDILGINALGGITAAREIGASRLEPRIMEQGAASDVAGGPLSAPAEWARDLPVS